MPRLLFWTIISTALITLVAFTSPAQMPVVLYKESLVTIAVVLGYWLDRALFPYARPHKLFEQAKGLHSDNQFYDSHQLRMNAGIATIRRALIVLAVVLGMTLGL